MKATAKMHEQKRKLTDLSKVTVFTSSADLYKATPARAEIKIANNVQSPAPAANVPLHHTQIKSPA
ncbi:hypothetical protein [Paenochrobactrum glaciei]|uniref:Uncharacterized protein n=1 Tax=Paenochrobactrum glaciei TaxID=486407 RepID=A0ABP3R095_9HYPH